MIFASSIPQRPTQFARENLHKTLPEKIAYLERAYPGLAIMVSRHGDYTLSGNALLHAHLLNAEPYVFRFAPGIHGSIAIAEHHVRLSWARHEHCIVILAWVRAPSEKARSFEKSASRTIRSLARLSKIRAA